MTGALALAAAALVAAAWLAWRFAAFAVARGRDGGSDGTLDAHGGWAASSGARDRGGDAGSCDADAASGDSCGETAAATEPPA
ncbi:MAG: hypothetical protein HZY79_02870 [Rhodoblastus sp.]|nr:MAG: hypothetical protein HZY79_02870 [Rhodoblastus sp.]